MKKSIKSFAFAGIIGVALFIASCGKDDEAPIITLLGDDPMTISLNSSFVDPLGTATDNEDGTSIVTSDGATSVNKDLAGAYTVTYTASDKEGNVGTATRTVNVVNDAGYLEGTYNTLEGSSTWVQTVSASDTKNNRIHFSRFADYDNNDDIYADVTGSTMSIGSQSANSIGNSNCNHIFTQNGTNSIPIAQVSNKWNFSIKFSDETIQGGASCTAGTAFYEDIFSQQ